MSTYLFFPPADVAQDEIWRYSCQTWGEKQAEKYIKGLHHHLQLLSERKRRWRPLPGYLVVPSDLNIEAYFSKYEHRYLFFRELSAGSIGIMAILHEQSDMPIRLCEDLRRIEEITMRGGDG
ncbi:type II toxin-antitoxin system RelE/ParE family toxin [Mariprofundus sp. EBB-1]|uniref:type II toxin-antitoxin system RelE/ParE family toxin n=1 Tax=Mariprofundus sp. EBB-1 TaxID=2650971 RepID=UPI000EF21E69|nr:type II toxin-antitoxin system RelE/ParE family toxin [Mariprofundus sp. EBB-1]RLL49701.1 type II toxin-antitoxin system RelE/ParE family toxin [Mariprofundus sp. EBB-1]